MDTLETSNESNGSMIKWIAKWMGVALVLHLIAVVYSTGFQNADEQFQIIEFLGYKLGLSPAADLPTEFRREMRPWLQSAMYWLPTRGLQGLGIQNPFDWLFSYRLLSSLIGWASLWMLSFCCIEWFKDPKWRKWSIVILALTWYFPALHARHSSENLSGSFFALGLGVLVLEQAARPAARAWVLALAGLLLGFAFEFRYQVAFMVAGLGLWLIFVRRYRLRELSCLAGGLALALAIGTLLDHWGYGVWGFAPLNYARFNLFEAKVMEHNTHPFWDYFRRSWTESWPVLGFVNLMGILGACALFPRHVLSWSALPFFLFHVLIGHKETRFLFPLAPLAPPMLVLCLTRLKSWNSADLRGKLLRGSAWFVGGMNLIALVALCFVPVWMPIRFLEKVYDMHAEGRISELTYQERDPYVHLGVALNFYKPRGLSVKPYAPGDRWVVRPSAQLPGCERVFSTIPEWVRAVDRFKLIRAANDWSLFRCES